MRNFRVTNITAADGAIPKVEFSVSGEGRIVEAFFEPKNGRILQWIDDDLSAADQGLAQKALLETIRDRYARSVMHPEPEEPQSLQRASSNKYAHRNARARFFLGVAHTAPAWGVLDSSSHERTFGYLATQGDPLTETAEYYDDLIRLARALGDDRDALMVITGDEGWMKNYIRSMHEPDIMVCVASEEILDKLDLHVIDRGWDPTQASTTLDDFLYPTTASAPPVPAEPQKPVKDDEPVEEDEPAEPDDPVEPDKPTKPAPRQQTHAVAQQAGTRRFERRSFPDAPAIKRGTLHDPNAGGFGTPDIPPMGAATLGGSGRNGAPTSSDPQDEIMFAQAQKLLREGSVSAPDEDDSGPGVVFPGGRAKEAMTGIEGSVIAIDGDMATVQFSDSPEPQQVPVTELEPA